MFAAVDLGSNSFHMIVARHEHGELVVIDRIREMVRLAAGLGDTGNLTDEGRERALESLARFGQRLERSTRIQRARGSDQHASAHPQSPGFFARCRGSVRTS